jgi:hypothetical protein
MADEELVLASKIEDSEEDPHSVTGVSPRVIAERGDPLPSELSDQEEQFKKDGLLVPKSMLPLEPGETTDDIMSSSLTEQEALEHIREVEEDEGGETDGTKEVKQALGVPTEDELKQQDKDKAKPAPTQTAAKPAAGAKKENG